MLFFWVFDKFSFGIEFLVEYVHFCSSPCAVCHTWWWEACRDSSHYVPATLLCGGCPCILSLWMSSGLYVLRFEYDVCECDFWVLFIFPTWYFLISIIVCIFHWIWKFLSYCILGNVGEVNGSVSLCVHICVQVCIPTHTCAEVRGQWWSSPSVVIHFSFETGSPSESEACSFDGQQTPRSFLFCLFSTGISDLLSCQTFLQVWGSELRSSCLYCKYFSYSAPLPILYFHYFCNFFFLLGVYNFLDNLFCSLPLYFSLRLF